MLKIEIPGWGELRCEHLVLDYNGTIAIDGKLLPGVQERLQQLAEQVKIHVITADTFGNVAKEVAEIPCKLAIIAQQKQDEAKQKYCRELGRETVVAIGNGRNDQLLLKTAELGIAIMQEEGAAGRAIFAADLLIPDILAAFDLLLKPQRLIATLRN
ncbi:ATPase, P-type (transporting), HAD superfamily, subfamily IC [Malonomonas rubra DSM 5091]|uniref:ATPase, P-type (Transporting), HAD superfamily, subfamily IC n=2 Tax=Malonomonas rubra TaxID=57040 RepID=A0A1M6IIA8_MALRU|nr:ATPase, P-type (transporting), HAD superfamily, subfamily IC [Malonomonas rubra DSM 5091]